MLNRSRLQPAHCWPQVVAVLLAAAMVMVLFRPAFALITWGTGNEPMRDPGWPSGAAAIFNNPARVAYWMGPPFGGGQYHAECRGDTQTFQAVLDDFAKLDVKTKRLIVHDGVEHSRWLDSGRKSTKEMDASIDWVFMIWVPDRWERLRKMPADLNPTDPKDAETGPPSTIDLYTGGNVHFSELSIPKGIEVVDNRLESHGYGPADGSVIEGKVTDNDTKKPLVAHVQLQRVTPVPKEGYRYSNLSKAVVDNQGRWVLKNVPAGWNRVVVEADGYVPRVASYFELDKQPRWQEFNCGLSRATTVSGRVTDSKGNPLADVTVELDNVASGSGGRYKSPQEYSTKTDASGRFHINNVPPGTASISVRKPGYCHQGLGPSIETPAKGVSLRMVKSARLTITVDFAGTKRPREYIVNLEQEGGATIGKWGGTAQINSENQRVFENVPPGKYVLQGYPNPTTEGQKTDPITIEIVGGKEQTVTLSAK